MTSYELRQEKEDFIRSVTSYLERHQEMLLKIKEIDKIIVDGNQDTSLIPFLKESNRLINEHIVKLDSDILKYQQETIREVDEKIRILEEAEELARKKKEEEL